MSAEASACPRCRAPIAAGQEYCLECGLRQPGRRRLGALPHETRGLRLRIAGLAAVACAGAAVAVAVAQQARTHGLTRVGVLDSSRFASLRPGYWMTFSGRYQSQADATGSLRRARAAVKGARVQRIEP